MKLIDQGYGNSGDYHGAVSRVIADVSVKYNYIATRTLGGHTGAIDGNFNWEIYGTNKLSELMLPSRRAMDFTVVSKKDGNEIDKENIARDYVGSLSVAGRDKLIEDVLVAHLTK